MSLYNMLFRVNHLAGYLLHNLKLDPKTMPRFRDAYLTKDPVTQEIQVTILTRSGGGNRPDYVEGNENLKKHQLYLRDEDDAHDNTYALFFFRLPNEVVVDLEEVGPITLEKFIERRSLKDKFDQAMEALKEQGGPDVGDLEEREGSSPSKTTPD
jgi:hypothetical protein